MKLSLSWIKDYVELPDDFDLGRLAYDLTMSTVEVEGAEKLADRFAGITVGIIREVNPHPNADRLRVCLVDIGGETKDIVCGGSNLYPGEKVAVANPGALVKWHGAGEPVVIKNAKLRGVESYGMICGASEIGLEELFPPKEETEIVDLSAFDVPAGTPVAEALGLDDIILEIDNKSMTNRPDLWGHYGIAREIAALYKLPLKPFEPFAPPAAAANTGFRIDIEAPELCPRYIGVLIENVSPITADFKTRSRIWRVGMRPINALVDITNYVMLATGQPTHAFDADVISGNIRVRTAAEGERLCLLNGKDLSLGTDDLVIADAEGPVALAGVMGGSKDSILPTTRRVILEVANFSPVSIRHTALRYDNRTEASSRYEKGIDTQRCDQALSMAARMFASFYPGSFVSGYCDNTVSNTESRKIEVSLDWLARRLGKNISEADLSDSFGRLGFETRFDGGVMRLTVPSWRSTGDVSEKEDVMEEAARMYGYENFDPAPITISYNGAINQLQTDLRRKIKEYLAFSCGMREVFTYPWMKEQTALAVLGSDSGILKLSTPPSPSEALIRSSLLPNLVDAVASNVRFFDSFSIFEEAQVFADRDYSSPYDVREKLPSQKRHIAGAFAAPALPGILEGQWRLVKGVLGSMPRLTHMEDYSFTRETKPLWSDERVWLNISKDGKIIGDVGLLSGRIALECGIKSTSVVLFELDEDALVPFKSRTNGFTKLPEFPVSEYDLSLLFDSGITWDRIEAAVGKGGELLKRVVYVGEYRGKQIPEGKKSVTLKLFIGSNEKTLTSEEIEACASSTVRRLCHLLGAELRQK